jgi:hypothetical protein
MDCGEIARFEPKRRHISGFFGANCLAHSGRQAFFFAPFAVIIREKKSKGNTLFLPIYYWLKSLRSLLSGNSQYLSLMASRMFESVHSCLPFFISRMEKKHEKGGIMWIICLSPKLWFCVMMIAIWLDDAGFWKWLGKKLK